MESVLKQRHGAQSREEALQPGEEVFLEVWPPPRLAVDPDPELESKVVKQCFVSFLKSSAYPWLSGPLTKTP